ncbi:hypothetical protein VQ056_01490 [Paenibacillus sp. JTLBN-2024]
MFRTLRELNWLKPKNEKTAGSTPTAGIRKYDDAYSLMRGHTEPNDPEWTAIRNDSPYMPSKTQKKALCIRNKAHESTKIDITTLFPALGARKLPVQHIHVVMQIKENSHMYPLVLWLPRFVGMKCSMPLYQI